MGGGGRLVIPAEFRRDLGLTPGVPVVITETEEGELRISTAVARARRAQQLVRRYARPGGSMVDELLAERREEAARE